MAYLNRDEREALLNDLKTMSFRKAKGRLQRIDPKGRMAYYRNAQQTGEFVTEFVLEGKGTQVRLIEEMTTKDGKVTQFGMNRLKLNYQFVRVEVEPTPENRT
ncbi:MAG TPA: hypothetical protein VER79_08420 [Candidatus Limnocylindrales bacterium]|jgi:hypothetical protein|nr:hypothetical protein [Candidatus Limnocylindrales bacterium]